MDLKALRARLDKINRNLVEMIAKRVEIGKDIGMCKKQSNLPVRDIAKEKSVIRSARQLAKEFNLPEKRIERIFKELIELNIEEESK